MGFDGEDHDFEGPGTPDARLGTVSTNLSNHLRTPFRCAALAYYDSAWCSYEGIGKHPAPLWLCPDGRSASAPRQPAAVNAPVTVKSSGVLAMSAPLTICAVMLAMRPVAPSSPNAAPRTCKRESERGM